LKILFVGDIVGEPGRKIVERVLPRVLQQHKIDCVIVNGENAAAGFGITPKIVEQLKKGNFLGAVAAYRSLNNANIDDAKKAVQEIQGRLGL
jgi:calcineurin-like phosphoesterase